MKQFKKLKNWRVVDDFKNEVYWSFHKDKFDLDSINFLESFVGLLKKNNIYYSLHADTKKNLLEEFGNKKQLFFEEIIIHKRDLNSIFFLLSQHDIDVYRDKYKRIIILKNKKIIKITTTIFRFSSKNLNKIKFNDHEYTYFKKSPFNYIISKISRIFVSYIFNKTRKYFTQKIYFKKNYEFKLRKITYKDFLKLKIEKDDSFNWILRKPHLDIVTQDGKNKVIKNIIKYFKKNKNFMKVKKNIIITNTELEFEEPIQINENFWLKGNNYFILSMLYQFRKNVIPYEQANKYIKKNKKPMLYSEQYYSHLVAMNDEEIRTFLQNNPIEIINNTVTSGRHRVFAMIGRILEDKQYIEFYAYVKK